VTSRSLATPLANPFATRATRSGMIPYQFPVGDSAAGLIECLRAAGWWGQVVGPHGSGKSTLVAGLLPDLARQAGEIMVARLHADYRHLPAEIDDALRPGPPMAHWRLLVIDGYEQLSLWRRLWLQRRCQRRGHGLLVTAHRPLWGLPVVYRTRATEETAWRVVRYLLPEKPCPFTPEDVAVRLAAHGGDVRELLFDLYDWYEIRAAQRRAELCA
jgi:hypothetical protein